MLSLLRDAPWLTARRVRDYAAILIAFDLLAIAWALTGSGINDPSGKPIGTDFLSFWTVSFALHHGEAAAIYQPLHLAALEQFLTGRADLFYAWAYPPIALLLVAPLALLPYLWSLAAWLLFGLAVYLQALWRILPHGLALAAGLAFPAVFITIGHGQNALLSVGLTGTGLALLSAQPVAAGIALGALAFKPQLGILLPLALAAGGHWRAFASAAATVAILAATTVALYGVAIWQAFFAALPFTHAMLDQGLVPYFKLQSIFAAARLSGASLSLAYGLQGLGTCAAAAAIWWAWRRPARQTVKNAVLVSGGLLATPFLLDYDLTLLALPIAWLGAEQREGVQPWERMALVAAFFLPLCARPLAEFAGIPATPMIVAALLGLSLRRCGAAAPIARQSAAATS
jgi:glycosyl transferase family 87